MGSTVWIIEQDRLNKQALAGIPCVEEYLASIISLEVAQGMLGD
jgi:glutamate synthase (NADPH/NADH) large chain